MPNLHNSGLPNADSHKCYINVNILYVYGKIKYFLYAVGENDIDVADEAIPKDVLTKK